MNMIFEELDTPISIEETELDEDYMGGQIVCWKVKYYAWAKVEKINNMAPQMRSKNFSGDFYKFTIRCQYKVARGMCIKHAGRRFTIETINQHQPTTAYQELIAYERVGNDIRI